MAGLLDNPFLHLGAGLLSVAGPSTQPQSLGTGLSRGLLAANQAAQMGQQQQLLEDEQARRQQEFAFKQAQAKRQMEAARLQQEQQARQMEALYSAVQQQAAAGDKNAEAALRVLPGLPPAQQAELAMRVVAPEGEKQTSLMQNIAAMYDPDIPPEVRETIGNVLMKPASSVTVHGTPPKPPTGYQYTDESYTTLAPLLGGPADPEATTPAEAAKIRGEKRLESKGKEDLSAAVQQYRQAVRGSGILGRFAGEDKAAIEQARSNLVMKIAQAESGNRAPTDDDVRQAERRVPSPTNIGDIAGITDTFEVGLSGLEQAYGLGGAKTKPAGTGKSLDDYTKEELKNLPIEELERIIDE